MASARVLWALLGCAGPQLPQLPSSTCKKIMASKESLKPELGSHICAVPEAPRRRFPLINKLQLFLVVAILPIFGLWYHGVPGQLTTPLIESGKSGSNEQLVRSYNLTIGTRWMNQGRSLSLILNTAACLTDTDNSPDGGRWRPMLVCNGQTPCPTLFAEEGDIVELHVQNNNYAQSSIHWYVLIIVVLNS